MGARTVLVVDASPLTARRAEEALHGSGYRAVIVPGAVEAEEVAAREEVAVLLCSLVFPKGNGYDLGRQIKARHPEVVVFLLCGPFEVYSQERARQSGVHDRIQRPFTAESFRRHLEGVLGPLGAEGAGDMPASHSENEERDSQYSGGQGSYPGRYPAPGQGAAVGVFGGAASVPASVPASAPASAPASVPASGAASVASSAAASMLSAPSGALMAPHVPAEEERLATFVPRGYPRPAPGSPDPSLIPVVERVVQEVLPEVLEAVLAQALHRSRAFQDLVELAVDLAVREQVGLIAERLIRERLREGEGAGSAAGVAGAPDGREPAGNR